MGQGAIVVCSPHAVLIAGFRALVAEPAGMTVIECPDIQNLQCCFETQLPELALIDGNSGITPQFLKELKPHALSPGLILWVDRVSPEFVYQAIAAGVRGILPKDAAVELYELCLHRVASHELWLDGEMTQKLLCKRPVRLSPRERQLVGLLTQGLRNKEIAWRMKITEGTTKVYLSRLFAKTGAGDRFELAMFALQNLDVPPITASGITKAYAVTPSLL